MTPARSYAFQRVGEGRLDDLAQLVRDGLKGQGSARHDGLRRDVVHRPDVDGRRARRQRDLMDPIALLVLAIVIGAVIIAGLLRRRTERSRTAEEHLDQATLRAERGRHRDASVETMERYDLNG